MSKYRKECWTDADVRCPFYISDERSARSITCEGCMEETKATMSFRTLANRDGHMGRFCVGTYERCPVYRSVYQSKYHTLHADVALTPLSDAYHCYLYVSESVPDDDLYRQRL